MRYLTFREKVCCTITYLYIMKFHYKRRCMHLYNALFNYLEWVIYPSEVNKFKYSSDLILFSFEKKFHKKIIGDNKYTDIFKKMDTKKENGEEHNFCKCKKYV